MCVWAPPCQDPRTDPELATTRLAAIRLRPGDQALFLGRAHYGCVATLREVCGVALAGADTCLAHLLICTLA